MPANSTTKATSRKKKPPCSTTHQSKTEQVRELLTQGIGPTEITRRLKCSRALVYLVKSRLAAQPPVYTLETLPRSEVRASENWAAKLPKNAPLLRSECSGCKRAMWTRDPKLEDLCDECAYQMMTEAAEAAMKRDIHNTPPAFDEDDSAKAIPSWGDPFRLF